MIVTRIEPTRYRDTTTDRLRYALIHRSVWYALPQVIPMLVRLGTIPILTRLLTPYGYGRTALWTATVTFGVVFVRWTDDVLLRWISHEDEKSRAGPVRDWAHEAIRAVFVVMACTILAAVVSGAWIWALVAIVIGVEAVTNSLEQYARALGRARVFACGALVSMIGTTLLALVFVAVVGAVGILLAWVVADIVAISVLLACLRGSLVSDLVTGIRDRKRASEMRRFGLPLIAATGSWMLLLFLDRFFVQAYRGPKELGLYALAFTLANTALYGLFMLIGFTIYTETVEVFERDGPAHTLRFIKESMKYYYALAIPMAFAVGFFARDVLGVLAPPSYGRAARMVPALAIGLFLQALLPFTTKSLILDRRSRKVALIASSGVGLNVIANFILIPRYGGQGAAIATALTYAVTLAVVELMSSSTSVGRVGLSLSYALPVVVVSGIVFELTSLALRGTSHTYRLASAVILVLTISIFAIVVQHLPLRRHNQRLVL